MSRTENTTILNLDAIVYPEAPDSFEETETGKFILTSSELRLPGNISFSLNKLKKVRYEKIADKDVIVVTTMAEYEIYFTIVGMTKPKSISFVEVISDSIPNIAPEITQSDVEEAPPTVRMGPESADITALANALSESTANAANALASALPEITDNTPENTNSPEENVEDIINAQDILQNGKKKKNGCLIAMIIVVATGVSIVIIVIAMGILAASVASRKAPPSTADLTIPVEAVPSPTPARNFAPSAPTPVPTPAPEALAPTPAPEAALAPTPAPTPAPEAAPTPEPNPTPEAALAPSPEVVPQPTPSPDTDVSARAKWIVSQILENVAYEISLEEGRSLREFFSINYALKPCKKDPDSCEETIGPLVDESFEKYGKGVIATIILLNNDKFDKELFDIVSAELKQNYDSFAKRKIIAAKSPVGREIMDVKYIDDDEREKIFYIWYLRQYPYAGQDIWKKQTDPKYTWKEYLSMADEFY